MTRAGAGAGAGFCIFNPKIAKIKKMRLEICYTEQCLKFLYDLIKACKQQFEICPILNICKKGNKIKEFHKKKHDLLLFFMIFY